MTDTKMRGVLIGGPLDGYHHEVDEVVERLHFNSLHRPGYVQHVYDLKDNDARFDDEPVYEHAGEDETNHPAGLERVGIDLPAHAFVTN
jgi:hypothetical protein